MSFHSTALAKNLTTIEGGLDSLRDILERYPVLPADYYVISGISLPYGKENDVLGFMPRWVTVIELRYGLTPSGTHTLKQVGEHLGIKLERVRQIEARMFRAIRQVQRRERNEGYTYKAAS